jgi:hypothetical protein
MTRKHFKKLADMLRREAHQIPCGPFDRITNDIADICKADNPNFNIGKFLDAVYGSSRTPLLVPESK